MSAAADHSNSDAQATRASLILRLRDPQNTEAWEQFVKIYTPLIYWFCCRRGLQEADAADVCQEALRSAVRSIGTFDYDRQKGKFRNWLLTVVRSKISNHLDSRQRQPQGSGQSTVQTLLEQIPAPQEQSDWDLEYHRQLFHWAAERIRPSFKEITWTAFWRTMVEQQDAEAVAASLGLSIGAVYVAKSRVLARFREEVQTVTDEDMAGLWA